MDGLSNKALTYLLGMVLEALTVQEKRRGEPTTVDMLSSMLEGSITQGNVAQFNFEALNPDERAGLQEVLMYVRMIRDMQRAR